MSILSELGKILGEKHQQFMVMINSNAEKVASLESTVTSLESTIIDLQKQVSVLQVTGSVHANDISIYGAEKGVVLQSEDYTQYRLRITSDKKLVIDDVTNDIQHINEIQLTPVDNDNDEIGEMTIGDDFEIS